jgi:glycosyltransferase involved in cell wall biosynthesis
MKISVAVPTHKRPKYLEVCLRSIFTQTLQPDEVVISEDGRDTATNQVIQNFTTQYPHIQVKHIVNEIPLGELANRQQAFELTTGEYVAMLDDDDMWHSYYLEKTYAALSRNADCGFCSCNHYVMDSNGTIDEQTTKFMVTFNGRERLTERKYDDVFFLTVSNQGLIFPLQFTMFRRKYLEAIGFFQPFGVWVPDITLFLALGGNRTNGYFITDYLGSCRSHNGQSTNTYRLRNTISQMECLRETYTAYRETLNERECDALKKRYLSQVMECAIAYAHEHKRISALRCFVGYFKLGFGFPSVSRIAVLTALMIGIKKKNLFYVIQRKKEV